MGEYHVFSHLFCGNYSLFLGPIGLVLEKRGRRIFKDMKSVDLVKWVAIIIQLIGYGMTGLNLVPYNIYMFFIGIFLWFAVGFMWKDRAIMVVHIGAFISLLVGYLNA